ncbi:hypothetical protein [Dictyobacter kobayashii]|uniref:Uncharacterized protein n=1 Tax=Dictyobacter kobayashii TaxID=2014872 RepID=A0A402AS17_9CHLR|nr:hypothetical protein [Dictyobacter kobayashii]GCE21889.1 hypothetical protein KDK_56890 [Dictyobacter kobayashii]
MPMTQIATLMAIPIAGVCLIISIRAFYSYSLSRSDMLFVLGLAMASISLGTFVGVIGETHLGGNTFSTDWARTYGACCGGLFIFLSSLVKSQAQMQQLKRAQIIALALLLVVILLTPLYPSIKSPQLSLILNGLRMLIYACAFIRYAMLYTSKATRFSFMMSIAFLVLVIGYGLNIPGMFQTSLIFITVIAATVRIIAYLGLLLAYSIG